MYLDNENKFLLEGSNALRTNLDGVYNISDFFNKYDDAALMSFKRQTGFLMWETNSVPTSQVIRKLFPRPSFLTSAFEVSLLKRIYVDGPLAGTHELVR